MIDESSRKRLAQQMKRFLDGETTVDEMLSSIPKSSDKAFACLSWEYHHQLIGGGHTSRFWNYGKLKINEIPPNRKIAATVERTILFLQTDLEYRWVLPWSKDKSLILFQFVAYVLSTALFMFVMLLFTGFSWPSWIVYITAFLILTAQALFVIIGGEWLRALATGIDRSVWPFYRRQEYKRARDCDK